jgi:hypothetical protein
VDSGDCRYRTSPRRAPLAFHGAVEDVGREQLGPGRSRTTCSSWPWLTRCGERFTSFSARADKIALLTGIPRTTVHACYAAAAPKPPCERWCATGTPSRATWCHVDHQEAGWVEGPIPSLTTISK